MMKTYTPFYLFVIICFLILPVDGFSQDFIGIYKKLQQRFKEKPVQVTGGITAGLLFSQAYGIANRQSPFSYRIAVNMNVDILSVNIPVSFNYSNGQTALNYKLPAYSFKGISPTYKWATLHLGNRSMELSKYSLSGSGFYGVGTEIKPGHFRFKALYGRLQKATDPSLLNVQGLEATYERKGWGFKTGYEKDGKMIELIYFQAKDDKNSILINRNSQTLPPAENLCLGMNIKTPIGKNLNFSGEYGLSIFTRNQDSETVKTTGLKSIFNALIPIKTSTTFSHAFKGSLALKLKKGTSVNLNYERIEPGYKTLGSLYFQNDLENYTIGLQGTLFKKVMLSGNIGVQRNDLNKTSLHPSSRIVGTINSNIPFTDRFSVNITFSNFSMTSIITSPVVPQTDPGNVNINYPTAQIAQISKNGTLNATLIANKKRTSVISALFSIQQAYAIQDETVISAQFSTLYMGNLSYNYTLPKQKMNFQSSLLINRNQSALIQSTNIAPSLGVKKNMLKNTFSLQSRIMYNALLTDTSLSGTTVISLNGNYTLLKKHSISLQIRYTSRKGNPDLRQKGFKEISGGVNYSWQFLK